MKPPWTPPCRTYGSFSFVPKAFINILQGFTVTMSSIYVSVSPSNWELPGSRAWPCSFSHPQHLMHAHSGNRWMDRRKDAREFRGATALKRDFHQQETGELPDQEADLFIGSKSSFLEDRKGRQQDLCLSLGLSRAGRQEEATRTQGQCPEAIPPLHLFLARIPRG